MMSKEQLRLAKVVKKIRLFRGFVVEEIEGLLRICTYRTYEAGEHK
jgi:hypothetical protein